MILYIVRHGETRLNVEGRLQGRVDEPLNEKGLELTEITGRALRDIPFDFAVSSPLSRAYQTAQVIVRENAKEEIPIWTDDRLAEFDWGRWDELCILPSCYELPVDYKPFFRDPFSFENQYGGETVRDVIRRTGNFYRELTADPENENKTILIATHGCAMRAMLNPFYPNPDNFWQSRTPPNCCVSIVEVKEGRSTILESDRIYYDPALSQDPYGDD